jgi:hypothetical protein
VRAPTDILLLHDRSPVGAALEAELSRRGLPFRHPLDEGDPYADVLFEAALGCRAIIAVGPGGLAPHVLRAANLPGLSLLVLVLSAAVDLRPLRRSGVPYVVVQAEAPGFDVHEMARCAVQALDDDEMCGRVVTVTAKRARWPRWLLAPMRALGRISPPQTEVKKEVTR